MKITQLLPIFLCVATTQAATLNVTTTADSGAGSLRAQVAAAGSGDTVAIIVTGTITLTTGEILVTGKDVEIDGPGANSLTITTNATTRALHFINANPVVTGITFNNCKGLPGDVDTGGAIAVDNFSQGGQWNYTSIADCVFTNNQSGWGGAVDIFNGALAMSGCTFSGNTCTGLAFSTNGGGGALSIGPTVESYIENCTFTANRQNGTAVGQPGGGAIYNYGASYSNPAPLIVAHCTFVGNVDAASAAGAIKGNFTASYTTAAWMVNSLLVNNQAPAAVLKNFSGNATGSLSASYTSYGGNVTDETATSAQFMNQPGDTAGSTALASSVLPTLALNGSVTLTHAITRGSPAQRVGVQAVADTDQRGAPRHAIPDAGAFELIEPEISVTVGTVAVAESGTLAFGTTSIGAPASQTITITNTQTSAFSSGPLTLGEPSSTAGFSVSGLPSPALANGQSATFTVALAAANTGATNAVLTFTGNDAFNAVLATAAPGLPILHTINLSGLVTDTADHWRAQHFGAGATNTGLAADLANPAADGIANLLKYSLGLDPNVAYPAGTNVTTGMDANGHLTMTIAKNPLAADVSLAVEVAGNLGAPSPWSSAGTTVDQNTPTLFQAHDNTPLAGAASRYIRLKVTRP